MDKILSAIVIAILAIMKLLITGICLAIGFRLGGLFMAHAEKTVAKRCVKPATV